MKDICDNCKFLGKPFDPVLPKFNRPEVKIMFIGENPSWEPSLEAPLAKNSISGQALDENYLKPLNLTRNDVWITNLIKCRYPKEIYNNKSNYKVEIQDTADRCCNLWIVEEILHSKPKIIVTLSDKEVYQRFRAAFKLNTPAKFNKAVGRPHGIKVRNVATALFPMIHPDISRPPDVGDQRKMAARGKWSRLHMEEHIPALKDLLAS